MLPTAILAEVIEPEAIDESLNVVDDIQEIIEDPGHIADFFSTIWDNFIAYLPTLILAIVILVLGFIFTKINLKLLSKISDRSKIDKTAGKFLHSLIKIVLYLVLFTIVLTVLGVPTTSLIAVIGSAGLAIGLALQSSLSNIAGGFLILFSKPFRIGDYIKLGDEEGFVEKITILVTQITTRDKRSIFIPNSIACSSVLENHSMNGIRRIELAIGISYESDYDKAISAINKVLDNDEHVLKNPAPFIGMLEHGASAIMISVCPFVKSEDYFTEPSRVLEGVRRAFDEEGISIPYNQLDVRIVENK